MADFVRTPKPASDWCTDGLQSHNIPVHDVDDAHTFFNQGLPHSQEPVAMREFTLKLLNFADLPMSLEATTDAFALLLLHDLDFECDYSKPGVRGVLFLKPRIPFRMGGELISAIPDFALQDAFSATTLLIGEDKRAQVDEESDRVAPQLIAQSIAAFTENNEIRRDRGQEPLLSMVIPGIGIAGGLIRFYLAHVTQSLVDAVNETAYATQPTIVDCYTPSKDPSDIIICFGHFKGIVRSFAEQLNED